MTITPINTLASVMAVALLAGCNVSVSNITDENNSSNNNNSSGNNSSQPTEPDEIASRYHGKWRSDAYGSALSIDKDSITFYQYTSDYCLISEVREDVTPSAFTAIYSFDDGDILDVGSNGTKAWHVPARVYEKNAKLPQSCIDNLIPTTAQNNYNRNPERDLDVFLQTFQEYYLDFGLENVDWTLVSQEAGNKIDRNSDDDDLFNALLAAIKPLSDIQVTLSRGGERLAFENKPSINTQLAEEFIAANNFSQPLSASETNAMNTYVRAELDKFADIIDEYVPNGSEMKNRANDQLSWWTSDDMGYLYVAKLQEFVGNDDHEDNLDVLDQVMSELLAALDGTDGLIIDLRLNNKGHDYLATALASYFIDTPTHLFSKQTRLGTGRTPMLDITVAPRGAKYSKPLILLASSTTTAAAELFALMMRERGQVTIIGEKTQGSFSNALAKQLPNGFTFSLSNEYYLTPDDKWFENSGLPVNTTQAFFTKTQRDANRDDALQRAIDLIED